MKTFILFFFAFAISFANAQSTVTIAFESNQFDIVGNNEVILQTVNPYCVVAIEGYASVDGSAKSNLQLSNNRANSVSEYIQNVNDTKFDFNVIAKGETSQFGNLESNRVVVIQMNDVCLDTSNYIVIADTTSNIDNSNVINKVNEVDEVNEDTVQQIEIEIEIVDNLNDSTNQIDIEVDTNTTNVVKVDINESIDNDSSNTNTIVENNDIKENHIPVVDNSTVCENTVIVNIDTLSNVFGKSKSNCVYCVYEQSMLELSKKRYYSTVDSLFNTKDIEEKKRLRKAIYKSYRVWEHNRLVFNSCIKTNKSNPKQNVINVKATKSSNKLNNKSAGKSYRQVSKQRVKRQRKPLNNGNSIMDKLFPYRNC